MSNPLTDVVPAQYRKYLYTAYAVIGVLIGATQVGYVAASQGQPTWLTVALAIYAYLGIALGFTAAANTTLTTPPKEG